MTTPTPSLKARALRLLAQREHSRLELQRKLAPFESEPGALAALLDALHSQGFINEQRVLESVLHRRAGQRGAARIVQELQTKGLDDSAIDAAVAALQDTEGERAEAVRQRKFGALPAVDAAAYARQARFLLARGFAGDLVRRLLKSPAAPDAAD